MRKQRKTLSEKKKIYRHNALKLACVIPSLYLYISASCGKEDMIYLFFQTTCKRDIQMQSFGSHERQDCSIDLLYCTKTRRLPE